MKDEDAYFRERKQIFQRTKTHISEDENAYFRERKRIKTKTQKMQLQKKTKTHKNEDAKKIRISIGALYKSLQIIKSSFMYKTIFRLPLEISIQHIILIFDEK